jgi:hypothetical protein
MAFDAAAMETIFDYFGSWIELVHPVSQLALSTCNIPSPVFNM